MRLNLIIKLACLLTIGFVTLPVLSIGQLKILNKKKKTGVAQKANVSGGPILMDVGDAGYFQTYPDVYELSTGESLTLSIYNRYEGGSSSYSGSIELNFPTCLTLQSATSAPAVNTPGYLTFNFNQAKSITSITTVVLQLGPVGDTIVNLPIRLKLNTTVSDSADIDVENSKINVRVLHPHPQPKGPTKGVKWLRTKSIKSIEVGDTAWGNSAITSIDTSADGKYVFVAGYQDGYGNEAKSIYYTAKYTLDGFSVWEKIITNEMNYAGFPVIQHTADGGCVWAGDTSYYNKITYQEDPNAEGILVKKWSESGGEAWRKFIHCPEGAYIVLNCLKVLATGEIVLAFSYESSVTGDITTSPADTTTGNLVLMKLNSAGNTLWYKIFRGNGDDTPFDLLVTKSGDLIVSGITNSTQGDISGYSGPDAGIDSDYSDVFVLKTDGSGNLLWSKTFSITHYDYFMSSLENNGSFLFSGFSFVEDQPPVDSLKNGVASWWLSLDKNGNKLDEKIWPEYPGYLDGDGNVGTWFNQIKKSADGNYVLVSNTNSYYGTFKAFHGNYDVVISKLTPGGNILWQKAIGGTDDDLAYAMAIDHKGNIIVGGETYSVDDDIYKNAAPDEGSMFIAKIGVTNIVKGKVFIDNNANHTYDAGEPLVNDGLIFTSKPADTTIARLVEGNFLANVDTGNYISRYVGRNNYFTAYPDSVISSFSSFDQQDSIAFALVPKPGIHDLEVSIVPLDIPRPGFDANYKILTKNAGTEAINNVVLKLAKSSKVNFVNANRNTTAVTIDTIAFQPINLLAGSTDELNVHCKLAAPPTLNNGDTLVLTAVAYPLLNDTTPANNKSTLSQIARGSFDPNDKSESHAGVYTSLMKTNGEPFQYQIRFQNTGTDTAFFITVKDTLDSQLDLTTLETIGSSHPYGFSIDNNVVTWHFDMIKLVDSTTDESNSHGFIAFRITPKETLNVGDVVANKAAIYFDYNLPVITNETFVTYVSPGCPVGNTWNGTVSSAWENAANWSCGSVPDANTEVVIKAGTAYQPEVSSTTATCKSILVQNGAHVWVKTGAKLDVKSGQ